MEEKQIPSMLLNILFSLIGEGMGRRSLIMLLRQAGLHQYIDNPPPLDDSPSISVSEYGRLLADIYELFGLQAAQPILLRGGRLAAAEMRRQRGAQFAVTSTALRFVSGARRMQLILDRLAEQGAESYGAVYQVREEDDAFYLEIGRCPYCAEIVRRSVERNLPVAKPVCQLPVAIVDEMVEWATGEKHLVQEVACIAQGAPVCRFRIGK
jgi:predicted hydrocarbon binding protein